MEAQNSCTPLNYPISLHSFTAVYIRHPQTKLERLVYTTKCRRTVTSDGMHLLSDLDVTATISYKISFTQERGKKVMVLTKLINVLWFFTSSPPPPPPISKPEKMQIKKELYSI